MNMDLTNKLESLALSLAVNILVIENDKTISLTWSDKSYDLGVSKFCRIVVNNTPSEIHIQYDHVKQSLVFYKPSDIKIMEKWVKKILSL